MVTYVCLSGSCDNYRMSIKTAGFSMEVRGLSEADLVIAVRIMDSDWFKDVKTLVVSAVLIDAPGPSQGLFAALENMRVPETVVEAFLCVYSTFSADPVLNSVDYSKLFNAPNSAAYVMCEHCTAYVTRNNFSFHANVEICNPAKFFYKPDAGKLSAAVHLRGAH